jgi:SlyX protein
MLPDYEADSTEGQRITDLEIKVSYHEDLLQELNKVVAQQQQQIGLLEKTCKLLYERINNLQLEKQDDAVDPPPPHY